MDLDLFLYNLLKLNSRKEGMRFLNNSEGNFRKCEKHSTRSFAYPSLQLSWMLNDLTRLKIKLNEIISQGVLQYHCIHYRAAVLKWTREMKVFFGKWKFSRLTKADPCSTIYPFTRFKQLFPISNGYSFLSFSFFFPTFLLNYYYYYYFRIIIHNFDVIISPLTNFENYLKVDLKVDRNFKFFLSCYLTPMYLSIGCTFYDIFLYDIN